MVEHGHRGGVRIQGRRQGLRRPRPRTEAFLTFFSPHYYCRFSLIRSSLFCLLPTSSAVVILNPNDTKRGDGPSPVCARAAADAPRPLAVALDDAAEQELRLSIRRRGTQSSARSERIPTHRPHIRTREKQAPATPPTTNKHLWAVVRPRLGCVLFSRPTTVVPHPASHHREFNDRA